MNEEGKDITVGKNIRRFRKEAGLTQKQLAEKTGIAEITIRQYESGKYKPKIDKLIKIADALNIPYYWLVAGPPSGVSTRQASINVFNDIVSMIKEAIPPGPERRQAILSALKEWEKKRQPNGEPLEKKFLHEVDSDQEVIMPHVDKDGDLFLEIEKVSDIRKRQILRIVDTLNNDGIQEAIKQLSLLARVPEYRKDTNNT